MFERERWVQTMTRKKEMPSHSIVILLPTPMFSFNASFVKIRCYIMACPSLVPYVSLPLSHHTYIILEHICTNPLAYGDKYM